MLAKVWKKFLLAVCIIVCIYNIMSKLVNRASLEDNLHRANDGETVFDFSSKESKESNSEIVEGVIHKDTVNNTSNGTVVTNTDAEDNAIREKAREDVSSNIEETNEENNEENVQEEPKEEKNPNEFKFTDFIFKW